MDYSLITEQQSQKKYYSLSDKIRSVLDSESSVMTVGQIYQKHHLDDERILIINQLVALILLGFVSPNDFRQEIMDNTHLNYQHSDDIAKEIYEKIFAPIRSEIDKIYSPVGVLTKESAPSAVVEKKESVIDLRILEKQKSEEEIKKPIEAKKEIEEEIKKPIEIEKEIIEKPVEVKRELPAVPFPIETISKTISKTEAAPVIIHKEIETKPTLGKQRSLGGLFGFLKAHKEGEKIQEQKPITAEVEIPILELPKPFGTAQGKPPVMSKVESPKVVHYSDLKTPVIKPTTNNLQPTTIKMPEVPLPLKPEIKSEIKNKVFESEIEKAKAAGLIVNNHQPIISSQQFKIEEIPIEIEEVSRQSFFSRIFQFLTGLFVTKKKVIREVPEQKENLISKLAQEKNKEEIEKKLTLRRDSGQEEFKFPIEIKLPEPRIADSPVGESLRGKPPKIDLQLKEFETSEINPVLSRAEGEIKEKPQPIMPQLEKPKTQDEEVIDLRTFQKVKKQ